MSNRPTSGKRTALVAVAAAAAGSAATLGAIVVPSHLSAKPDPALAALAKERTTVPTLGTVAPVRLPKLHKKRPPRQVVARPAPVYVSAPAPVQSKPKTSPSPGGGEHESEGGGDD